MLSWVLLERLGNYLLELSLRELPSEQRNVGLYLVLAWRVRFGRGDGMHKLQCRDIPARPRIGVLPIMRCWSLFIGDGREFPLNLLGLLAGDVLGRLSE
jgi:hypothetical protein